MHRISLGSDVVMFRSLLVFVAADHDEQHVVGAARTIPGMKVAELNKQRNSGPVRSLRNEWLKFQQYSRLTRNETEDENIKNRITSLKKQMQGIEDRIAQHEEASRKIEDQIFQANQPKPRKYFLKRVPE